MRQSFTVVVAFAVLFSIGGASHAQSRAFAKGKPPSPTIFLGKTFQECEKTFGKPKRIDPAKQDEGEIRYYKSANPNLVRVLLYAATPRYYNGRFPNDVVVEVEYQLPNRVKSWQAAFSTLGLDSKSVRATQVTRRDGSLDSWQLETDLRVEKQHDVYVRSSPDGQKLSFQYKPR